MNEYQPPGSVQGYMLPVTRNCHNCLFPVQVLLTLHGVRSFWACREPELVKTGKKAKVGLS